MSDSSRLLRVRWAAIGAALAVSLGAGGIGIVNATISSGSKAVYVPISPCRLADTRPGTDNVGTRNTPIGPGQTHTFTVRGANGQCSIPAGATAIVANVTAVTPTAQSFMTIWPSDGMIPNASSLNYSAGQAPFPNAVTVRLSADGKINVFNKNGNVHVIIDIAGYYEDHDHDDRYYTKAQIDTVAGPVQRTISFPAQSMNYVAGAVISENSRGLAFTNSSVQAAHLAVAKPTDFAGTGQVTMTVTYYRTTAAAGDVSFFTRPQDLGPGSGAFNDETSVSGSTESAVGAILIRQNTISWAAVTEDGPVWNIHLQRSSTIPNPYPDPVIVTSVSLTYDATR
jgi:hypothetical protein